MASIVSLANENTSVIDITYLTHSRLHYPNFAAITLRIPFPFISFQPPFPHLIIHRAANDLDLWECSSQDGYATASGDEKRNEYDSILPHTMIKKDTYCHEACSTRADLKDDSSRGD